MEYDKKKLFSTQKMSQILERSVSTELWKERGTESVASEKLIEILVSKKTLTFGRLHIFIPRNKAMDKQREIERK